ncbi:MAG: PepSY domain-containing protein [Pseudomonadota bacterium]
MTHLNKPTILILTILSVHSFNINAAMADDDAAEIQLISKAAGLISLEQATEKTLQAKPGTVIEVELEKRSWPQGWDYEFEIIDAQGHEWDVDIDAKTGEVRKVSRDWF